MRRALEVADIFRRHGAAYREAHAGHLSRGQRRVMGAIETCRSAALGGHVEQCSDCDQLRIAYNSHCVVPGGGPSVDRTRWIGCRPGFFLPVKVLSRLYRRLFLTRLRAAFDAGQLRFFGDLASLAAPSRLRYLAAAVARHSLGRLHQATVRRTRAGARLSRPLYPSRRDRPRLVALTEGSSPAIHSTSVRAAVVA